LLELTSLVLITFLADPGNASISYSIPPDPTLGEGVGEVLIQWLVTTSQHLKLFVF
jgi:hypothetical protein